MSNTNRIFWIDLVKGIAIILVVVGHILQMRLQPLLTGLYEFIFNFHMPLFLFMSGYVLKSIIFKANMNYLLDKYKRLMIPCVVFGALNCLLRREDLIYVLHWFTFGVFTKKMFFPLANAEKSVATYMGGVL